MPWPGAARNDPERRPCCDPFALRQARARTRLPSTSRDRFNEAGLLRRVRGVVLVGAKRPALVALGDRVLLLIGFARQDFGRIGLGIVLWPVTESKGVRL